MVLLITIKGLCLQNKIMFICHHVFPLLFQIFPLGFAASTRKHSTMGATNQKQRRESLLPTDLEFIATHTEVSRQDVEAQYQNFKAAYPDGKITKQSFK